MIEIRQEQFSKYFEKLIEKSTNLKPLMREIAGILSYAIEENFETEGKRLNGTGWPALASSTLKKLQKKGKIGKMLQRSAAGLASSISTKYTESTAEAGPSPSIKYAAIQQFGGIIRRAARSETFQRLRYKKGSKKGMFKKGTQQGKGFSFRAFEITIPARPYLAINQEDEEKIIDKITKYHT